MDQPVNIVLSCDDNFAQPAGVLMMSILSTAKTPERIAFHLIDGGIHPENRGRLLQIVDGFKAGLTFLEVDSGKLESVYVSNQLTAATYYRLEALPASVERCIYLDSDMVAFSDIAELWNIPLNGKIIGAAIDHGMVVSKNNFGEKMRELGLSKDSLYFNAGMLLVDLKKWREAGIDQKAMKLALSRSFRSHDQDVLNMLFKDNWEILPSKWNAMPAVYGFNFRVYRQRKRFADVSEARKSFGIVHYAGRYKPWEFRRCEPFNGAYVDYLMKTPFGGKFTPKASPRNEGRSLIGEKWRLFLGNLFYGKSLMRINK